MWVERKKNYIIYNDRRHRIRESQRVTIYNRFFFLHTIWRRNFKYLTIVRVQMFITLSLSSILHFTWFNYLFTYLTVFDKTISWFTMSVINLHYSYARDSISNLMPNMQILILFIVSPRIVDADCDYSLYGHCSGTSATRGTRRRRPDANNYIILYWLNQEIISYENVLVFAVDETRNLRSRLMTR